MNNKAVVNSNYGRLQYVILLFKISVGTRTNNFEIRRRFGHAPLNKVRQPCYISSIQEQRNKEEGK